MPQLITLGWVAAVLVTLSGLTSVRAAEERPSDLDEVVESAAADFLTNGRTLGLSIGIHRAGKSASYHFGTTAPGGLARPTSQTQYCLGSITKTFTGALLAQAAVEGRISLNDDVRKWLPGAFSNLEYSGHPVRLWQLINHTSGLPLNLPLSVTTPDARTPQTTERFEREAAVLAEYSQEAFLRDIGNVKLAGPPGERFSYSNAAAQLAGLILERVYGQTYEVLVRAKITGPLAMDDTKVVLDEKELARFAKGYCGDVGFMPPCSSALPAHAALKSTTADMLKYVAWQLAEADEAVRLAHQAAGTTQWTTDNSYGNNILDAVAPGR